MAEKIIDKVKRYPGHLYTTDKSSGLKIASLKDVKAVQKVRQSAERRKNASLRDQARGNADAINTALKVRATKKNTKK